MSQLLQANISQAKHNKHLELIPLLKIHGHAEWVHNYITKAWAAYLAVPYIEYQ